MKKLLLVLSVFISATAFANTTATQGNTTAPKKAGPCRQIREACEGAGFVKGEVKDGYGLWDDCINPIMQGVGTVPNATKPLPTVDPSLISACKAKHADFGHGQVGSKHPAKK